MKQTTVFLFILDFLLLINFHIKKTPTKNKAIIKGRMQATNVLTTKIEFMKKLLLKSAKKQSKDIIVSVV